MGKESGVRRERTDPKALGVYLGSNYAQLQGLIRHLDTKANIVIVLVGALASMFFNVFMSGSNILYFWQVVIVLGSLLVSGLLALSVIYPRSSQSSGEFSLTYFRDAQNVDVEKWSKKFLNSDQEELITKDLIRNIKAISIILNKKMVKLRLAYIMFALAVLLKVIFDVWIFFV